VQKQALDCTLSPLNPSFQARLPPSEIQANSSYDGNTLKPSSSAAARRSSIPSSDTHRSSFVEVCRTKRHTLTHTASACRVYTRSHAHPHAARHERPVSGQFFRSNRPVVFVNTAQGAINSVVIASQPTLHTNPLGQNSSLQYDSADRTLEVRDASSASQYQYDAADRITQIDTTTAAGSHRLQYSYDSLDRITSRTLSGQGIQNPETTNYAWDNAGRLLSHTTTFAASAAAGGAGAGSSNTPNHATHYR
jgi:YD repeat-containing protein